MKATYATAATSILPKARALALFRYALPTAVLLSSTWLASAHDLLVSSAYSDQIKRYHADTGAFVSNFNVGGSLDAPVGLAFGPDDNLYVAAWGNGSVKRYNGTNGAYMGEFVPVGSGGLSRPEAVVFGPDGHLYVGTSQTAASADYVRRYDGHTGAFLNGMALGGLDDSDGLAFGEDGKLYVTSYMTHQVKRFDPANGAFIDNFASGSGLAGPVGVAFGPDGNLYVASYDSNRIKRFNGVTGAFIDDFVATGLNKPYHLVFGPDGNLYVANFGSAQVKRFSGANGAFLGIAAQGGGLNGPAGLLFVPPNHRPVADASGTQPTVISANGTNAMVVLDGTRSSDPDGDPLQYIWYEAAKPGPLAYGAVAVVVLPVGPHLLLLAASDGLLKDTNAVTVEVLTTAQAVDRLAAAADAGTSRSQPLIATLSAALASIDRSTPVSAVNQLLAFQNQVGAQVAPLDPALANDFLRTAQEIIDVITGGSTNPGGRPHAKFTAVQQLPGGSVQMQFCGQPGPVHILEATTNLVDWEMIGVAVHKGDGTFTVEDIHAPRFTSRYYRLVSP